VEADGCPGRPECAADETEPAGAALAPSSEHHRLMPLNERGIEKLILDWGGLWRRSDFIVRFG
jgi:hypothetical protein